MGVWHIAPWGMALPPCRGWLITILTLAAAMALSPMVWGEATAKHVVAGRAQSSSETPHGSGPKLARLRLATVRDIRYWSNPTYTRVVIDVDVEVRYRAAQLHNPSRLYLDLLRTQLSPQLHGRPLTGADHILKGLRVAQNQPDVVRVVLDLKTLRDYHVFTLSDPYRVVIDIQGMEDQGWPPSADASGAAQNRRASKRPAQPPRLRTAHDHRWHVVLDPGHGGKDPGAIGPSGVLEKDIVLDIAQRLRRLMLREPSWRVTMTRDRDVFIPLEERTAIANAKGADLFVSIHANAAERADLYGTETYFLDLSTDEQAMRTAARENATSLKKVSDLELILRDLVLTSKRNESSLLAGSVQQALVQAATIGKNTRDLGVKHAPFLVLIGAEMPAILVEAAFLSNPTEEHRLASPRYREQAAKAILAGLKEYIAVAEGTVARQVSR